jgi:hypothetical protein
MRLAFANHSGKPRQAGRCRRGWVAISAGRVNAPVSGPSWACMSPGRSPRLIARRSRGTWHLASGAGTSWSAWPRCPPCCAGCLGPAAAQPSGDSAAAHKRDAGEALLGPVLSRMVVRRRRRALGAVAAVLAGAAAADWALRPGSPPVRPGRIRAAGGRITPAGSGAPRGRSSGDLAPQPCGRRRRSCRCAVRFLAP